MSQIIGKGVYSVKCPTTSKNYFLNISADWAKSRAHDDFIIMIEKWERADKMWYKHFVPQTD